MFRTLYLLGIAVLLAAPMRAAAEDWQAAKRARDLIRRQVEDINKRGGDVDAKLKVAVEAKMGERQKWQELAQEVSAYEQTFSGTIQTIDQQVKNLIDATPDANVPAIEIGSPFTPYIGKAQARIKEIERAEIEIDQKIAQIDQQIAKFNSAVQKSTREAFNNTLTGFLPSEEQLLAEGGVVVFGAYFGPPGIAAAALAAGATAVFNQYVSFYYESKSLAEQGKAFTDMIGVLQRKKQQLAEAKASYGPAIGEMRAVESALQQHQKTYEKLRKALNDKAAGWTGYVASARRRRDSEIQSELDAQLTREVEPTKARAWWPGDEPPKIEPDEWRGPAQSPISTIGSAVSGALDGGNPAAVAEAVVQIGQQRRRATEDARKKYDEAYEKYQDAARTYYDGRRRASEQLSAALRRAENREQRNAAYAAYDARVRALIGPFKNPAYAAAMAQRECRIVSLTNGQIGSGWRMHAERLNAGTRAVRAECSALWSKHRQEFEDARKEFWLHASPAHTAYYRLRWLQRVAGRVDWEIDHSMTWGGTVSGVAASLETNAREARDMGEILNRELPLARSALTQVAAAGSRAEGALESFYAQYGLLMDGGHSASSIWWYDILKEEYEVADRLGRLGEYAAGRDEWMKRQFAVEEPAWLDDAAELNPQQIAGVFAEKAGELQYVVDCQQLFRARMTQALAQLTPISRQYTGEVAMGARDGSATKTAEAVLRKPEWMQLAAVCNQLPEGARTPLTRYHPPYEQQTARQRLSLACMWLSQHMNEQMKNYLQAKRYGGFSVVPQTKVDEVAKHWAMLKPALTAWDARVGERGQKFRGAAEAVRQLVVPVAAAYAQVPGIGRGEISGQYRALGNDVSWLATYLERMAQGLAPLGNMGVGDHIETTLAEYAEGLERRNKLLAEQRRREEERRRAEEERRKAEEEQRRREEEAREKLVQQVQSFYNEFKTNYERRSAAGVVALLDDDWSAGDGTTIADLEETLDNSFRVFDEVQCSIGGLQVVPQADGTAKATYTMQITGRIYRNRIKHEDSSDVTDILRTDGGKPRILKTTKGRFWYQQ